MRQTMMRKSAEIEIDNRKHQHQIIEVGESSPFALEAWLPRFTACTAPCRRDQQTLPTTVYCDPTKKTGSSEAPSVAPSSSEDDGTSVSDDQTGFTSSATSRTNTAGGNSSNNNQGNTNWHVFSLFGAKESLPVSVKSNKKSCRQENLVKTARKSSSSSRHSYVPKESMKGTSLLDEQDDFPPAFGFVERAHEVSKLKQQQQQQQQQQQKQHCEIVFLDEDVGDDEDSVFDFQEKDNPNNISVEVTLPEEDSENSFFDKENPNNVSVEVTLPEDEDDFLDDIGVECRVKDKARPNPWYSKRLNIGMATCLLMGFIAMIVGFSIAAKDSSSKAKDSKLSVAPTVRASMAPSETPVPFENVFLSSTWKALEDDLSPQSKAYEFVLNRHPVTSSYNESDTAAIVENWRKEQVFALATIYYSFHGEVWQDSFDWLQHDVSECDYWYPTVYNGRFDLLGDNEIKPYNYMDTCDSKGKLQSLILSNLELPDTTTTTIPPEVVFLAPLKQLILPSNNITAILTDFLPNEMYTELSELEVLNLSDNNLFGFIPPEISSFTSLTELDLSENSLSGTVPTSFALMTELTDLYLYGNSLVGGELPTEIGSLLSLAYFEADGCIFSGSIPTEVGLLTNMQHLTLHYNSLTGMLPSELGLLTAATELSLVGNKFSSTIPSTLGLLSNLSYLYLFSMALTGEIPSTLALMTGLGELALDNNLLSGSISSSFGKLKALTKLSLDANALYNELPTELGQLTDLVDLRLHNNTLSGWLPSELGLLTAMTELSLHSNEFSGTIPNEFGSMLALQFLRLNNLPGLTGTIPPSLGNLQNITYINLRGTNALTGEVPADLCGIADFDCGWFLCGCDCLCTPLY